MEMPVAADAHAAANVVAAATAADAAAPSFAAPDPDNGGKKRSRGCHLEAEARSAPPPRAHLPTE